MAQDDYPGDMDYRRGSDIRDYPAPQSTARWYLMFFGLMLIVFGIAALTVVDDLLAAFAGGVLTVGIVWLLTALVALAVAFAVRNITVVRWTAGILGAIYWVWGIVVLATVTSLGTLAGTAMMVSAGGILVILGALGVASALVPANWLYGHREARPYAT